MPPADTLLPVAGRTGTEPTVGAQAVPGSCACTTGRLGRRSGRRRSHRPATPEPALPLTVHEDPSAPPGDLVGALAALLLERARLLAAEGELPHRRPGPGKGGEADV
jgi:hypothetical protein